MYLSVVMETREELLCQYKDHAQQLKQARASPPKCVCEMAASSGDPPAHGVSKEDAGGASLVVVRETPEEDVSCPVILSVPSCFREPRLLAPGKNFHAPRW